MYPLDDCYVFKEISKPYWFDVNEWRSIRSYIENRSQDELAKWDVLIAGVNSQSHSDDLEDDNLGIQVKCQRRTAGDNSNISTLFITNKARVASRGVESNGLLPDDVELEAEKAGGRSCKVKANSERGGQP